MANSEEHLFQEKQNSKTNNLVILIYKILFLFQLLYNVSTQSLPVSWDSCGYICLHLAVLSIISVTFGIPQAYPEELLLLVSSNKELDGDIWKTAKQSMSIYKVGIHIQVWNWARRGRSEFRSSNISTVQSKLFTHTHLGWGFPVFLFPTGFSHIQTL